MTSSPVKDYGTIYDSGVDGAWSLNETGKYLDPLLDKMAWGHGEKILDHGCGTGSITVKFLAPRAQPWESKIYGVDISESMLSVARSKYGHPNVEYILTDVSLSLSSLSHMHGFFDKVLSIWAFRNVYNKLETVQKWFELLKPGGQFLMLNCVDTVYTRLNRDLKENPRWGPLLQEGLAEGYWYPDPASTATSQGRGAYHLTEYVRLLSRSGFIVQDNFVCKTNETYDSATCAENVISCNPQPFVKCMTSKADQLALEADILASFEKHCQARVLPNGGGKQFLDESLSVYIRAVKPKSGQS